MCTEKLLHFRKVQQLLRCRKSSLYAADNAHGGLFAGLAERVVSQHAEHQRTVNRRIGRPQEIAAEIDRQMDRGATFLHGEGSFSRQDKLVIMCAFKQRQIVPLKALVHEMDPEAFIIVCDAHEVLGQGFRRYQKNDI